MDLDEPKATEVRIRVVAAGLCHSDDHVRTGDAVVRYPMVGGHEGAGIVEAVGSNVTRVKVGDHVVCSFIPVCGTCRPCSPGHQNLCEAGINAGTGMFLDGTFRFHKDGEDLGGLCTLGTFSDHTVVSERARARKRRGNRGDCGAFARLHGAGGPPVWRNLRPLCSNRMPRAAGTAIRGAK